MKFRYTVTGMGCAACAEKVENAVTALEGVAKAKVSLKKTRLDVTLDPEKVSADQLIQAVEAAGYGLVPND